MEVKDLELKYQGLLQRFTTTMGSYEDTIAQLRVDLTKLESENNELKARLSAMDTQPVVTDTVPSEVLPE